MKKKPIIFPLKSEMLPFTIVFYIGQKPSGDIVGKICKEFGIWNGKDGPMEDLPARSVGCVRYFSGGVFMWMPRFSPSNPKDMDTFVHEMIHIVSKLSETIRQPINADSDEIFAYFAGWATEEFMKRVKKDKKRKKRP